MRLTLADADEVDGIGGAALGFSPQVLAPRLPAEEPEFRVPVLRMPAISARAPRYLEEARSTHQGLHRKQLPRGIALIQFRARWYPEGHSLLPLCRELVLPIRVPSAPYLPLHLYTLPNHHVRSDDAHPLRAPMLLRVIVLS